MRLFLGKLIILISFVLGAVILGKAECPQVQKPAACMVSEVNVSGVMADDLFIMPSDLNYIWFIPECASVPEVRFVTAGTMKGYVPADYKPPEFINSKQAVNSFNLIIKANTGDTQILNCQNQTTSVLHYTYRNPRDAI